MLAKSPNLSDPISQVPYVGDKIAKKFANLGILTVEDLFLYMPRRVVDLTNVVTIQNAIRSEGKKVVVYGEIENLKVLKTQRRRIWITSAKIKDKTGSLRVVWFHQPYLRSYFKDQKYVLYGTAEYSHFTKEVTLISPEIFPEPGVIPIYHLTEGITSKMIQRTITHALSAGYELHEIIPQSVLKKYGFPTRQKSFLNLHFPKNVSDFEDAKGRFIFEELLVFMLGNLYLRGQNRNKKSYKIKTATKLLEEFLSQLPFILTSDQKKALKDILIDFKKTYPMNRLLQGDVGSGKTVVALAAAYLTAKSGLQTAYLAPTQILAHQHFETAKKILEPLGIKVEIFTAATMKTKKPSDIIQADLLIGTHAILQKSFAIPKLALVIVDEQHRFGVEQRNILLNLKKNGPSPHLLSLSATPIPRTYAHIVFGNLDISTIKVKPSGRLPIKTFLIPQDKRTNSYRFIDELIGKGQQAFVICPLIEERESYSETLFEVIERKSVESEIKNLKKTILKQRRIAMLHGKMKSFEKQEKMKRLQTGEIDVLVSTSVVEVGVDVPRATAMVIEEAERFGLSQLHQFRGRVGRSDLQSYCFLFTNGELDQNSRERLRTFVQNSDGFKLSELDLKQRGPGAIFGTDQSGFKGLNPLWFENSEILRKASSAANDIIGEISRNRELFKIVNKKIAIFNVS